MSNAPAPKGRKSVTVPTNTTLDQRVDEFELELDYDEREGKRLRRSVESLDLPDRLHDIVVTYQAVLGDRRKYQWKWLYRVFDEVTLPCVPDRYSETVKEVKTIVAMYSTILDDLADEYDDPETFWELAKVAYPGTNPDWDRPGINSFYATVVREVWQAIDRRLRDAPRYEEFADQFLFGLRRALTSMDHALLSGNCTDMANLTETWLYGANNLMMPAFIDVDLMFSPAFSMDDYDELREIGHTVQQMWRIGNWVTTWEREVREHDYSAGVVVAALQEGVVSRDVLDQLEAGDVSAESVIERIREAGIEEAFLADWQRRRDELRARDCDIETVDIDPFIDGVEMLMKHQLASRGRMKER